MPAVRSHPTHLQARQAFPFWSKGPLGCDVSLSKVHWIGRRAFEHGPQVGVAPSQRCVMCQYVEWYVAEALRGAYVPLCDS